MNNVKKHLAAAVLLASALTAFAVSPLPPEDKQEISEGLTEFAGQIMVAAPEASTQMNVWSDAHIGNLYPSIHPHFGAGFSFGGTAINMSGFKRAADTLAEDFNTMTGFWSLFGGDEPEKVDFGKIPEKFILPTASFDLRLGGLFLPFDIGIFAVMTNPDIFSVKLSDPRTIYDMSQAIKFSLLGFDGSFDYLSIGGDFRIRLIQEDGLIPMISLGAGYAYTKGVIKVHTEQKSELSSSTQTTEIDLGIGYQTQVIFLQTQISKDLSIFSLYAGARGILSNTTSDWNWGIDSENDTLPIEFSDSDSGCVTSKGISDIHQDGKWDFSLIQPQVFAGCSLNMPKTQLTLGLCADIRSLFDKGNYTDFIWSGSLGLHFKI